MHKTDQEELVNRLVDYIVSFDLPACYKKILIKQISGSAVKIEQYTDCFKLLFEPRYDVELLPLEIPPLLQGCQILKDSGPISCQLFVEKGYVVQFEVVDMGGNPIEWDFFWANISNAIFDVDYNKKADRGQGDGTVS